MFLSAGYFRAFLANSICAFLAGSVLMFMAIALLAFLANSILAFLASSILALLAHWQALLLRVWQTSFLQFWQALFWLYSCNSGSTLAISGLLACSILAFGGFSMLLSFSNCFPKKYRLCFFSHQKLKYQVKTDKQNKKHISGPSKNRLKLYRLKAV